MHKSLDKLSLDLLRVFHQTARFSSMTLAAKSLFITQPAVSHAVSVLEAQLGYPLFARVGRKLHLTDEARSLYRTTSEMFAVLGQGEKHLQELRSKKTGVLRIGCPFLLLKTRLTPMLAAFHRKHPQIQIRVEIENRMQPMLELLRTEKVDLLFLATPEKKRIDAEFAQEELGTYRYALMASREHFPELFGKRLSLEAVNRYPIVILRPGNNTRDCLERVFAEAGLEMNVQWETETMALTEEFTKSGFGIGAMIAEDQPITHSEVPGVFELQLEAPLPGGRHFVLHRQETTLPSSAQMFLNAYREKMTSATARADEVV